ncbi:LacI family DNA-binding transcriptional regulator [Amycolatopsis jejuensis]|uniref:LacI family DNA-binding transcriptional regulator n=1 Tax=Amycolatopsis jejuensis TaxID=330084 RepID=UPI00068E362E|nr:LacI family DNA-binding transcriptional regulator [Amycolatopsis jejuensis]
MRDVATAASVSVKTVSRVVHNYPFISDDVRSRVQAEIRRLGFRPNGNAVNLRRTDRPAGGIGVLVADLADPFYSGMVSAIEQVSTARSFTTLVASSDEDPDRERALLTTLVERRLDGLIVVSADRRHDHLRPDLDVGTRMVFADRPPNRLPVDCVLAAHADGAAQAVDHLLRQGHRAIAYVGHSPAIHTARQRLSGFRTALAAAGLEPHSVRTDATDADAALTATAELLALNPAPTAVFTDNPRLVSGVAQAIAESPTPNTALVAFDDSDLARVLGVTVVAQDPRELGRRAAELLFARLDGDHSRPRRIILPTTLLPRGSGEGLGVALRPRPR